MNASTIEAITYRPPVPPPPETTLIAHKGAVKMTRAELATLPIPEATRTHKPIPHVEVIQALIQTLGFRHLEVTRDEYAATPDGNKMFGILEVNSDFHGCRFAIGIRNSNDKSMRLALTIGYRVMVCDNMSFKGDFTPVLAKHSASTKLEDLISVGVDRMQKNFPALQQSVLDWQNRELSPDAAKLIMYAAFVEGELSVSSKLLPSVHRLHFNQQEERFAPNTFWRLSNAFTGAFKQLAPIQQFQASAKLGTFLGAHFNHLPPF